MPTNILIQVPNSLRNYHDHLQRFFEGMMVKLHRNSHKKTPTTNDIPTIIDLLREEIREFEQQFFEDKDDENVLIELMDAANFAFLAYVALRLQDLGNGNPNRKDTQV